MQKCGEDAWWGEIERAVGGDGSTSDKDASIFKADLQVVSSVRIPWRRNTPETKCEKADDRTGKACKQRDTSGRFNCSLAAYDASCVCEA